MDYCTALFSSPVIVVKVLKVTTSKQSIALSLPYFKLRGTRYESVYYGIPKDLIFGGGLSSKFSRSEFFQSYVM